MGETPELKSLTLYKLAMELKELDEQLQSIYRYAKFPKLQFKEFAILDNLGYTKEIKRMKVGSFTKKVCYSSQNNSFLIRW